MALKISAMPAAAVPLTGAELVPLVQGGANVKGTVQELADFTFAPPGAVSLHPGGSLTLQGGDSVGAANASPAAIRGGDAAGTGAGGDLLLDAGSSVGGAAGNVLLGSVVNLPTADPLVSGALWIDVAAGHVIKVSP